MRRFFGAMLIFVIILVLVGCGEVQTTDTPVPLMLPTPNGVDAAIARDKWPNATPPDPDAAVTIIATGVIDPAVLADCAAADAQLRPLWPVLTAADLSLAPATGVGCADMLKKANITPIPGAPTYRTINSVRLALVPMGYPLPATFVQTIAAARGQADVVIVTFGWADKGAALTPQQAQAIAAAGVDMIIGVAQVSAEHYRHVATAFRDKDGQPRDTIIMDTLGTLIGPAYKSGETALLYAMLDRHGVRKAALLPLVRETTLRLPKPEERGEAMRALATKADPTFAAQALYWDGTGYKTCAAIAYNRDSGLQPDGSLRRPRTATLSVRDIDGYTGGYYPDKAPPAESYQAATTDERIKLNNGRLTVYRNEAGQWQQAWQSKPEWDVQQVVFGDTDNDGRREILFSLWKTDNDGVVKNHPFVYGFRKDAIRPAWSGSAVARPIREFALADIEGDDTNEFVVLDGDYTDPRNAPARGITILRWGGWVYEVLAQIGGTYYGMTQVEFAPKDAPPPTGRPSTATPSYGYLFLFGG